MKTKSLKIILPVSIMLIATSCLYIFKFKSTDKITFKNQDTMQIEKTNATEKKKIELAKLESYLDDEFLLLCNKDNKLAKDFIASDIAESNLPFLSYITTTQLNKTATENAKKMFDDAKKEGIILLGASGYRTNAVQTGLFNSKVANVGMERALKYSAPPGASEHETGLAIDIVSSDYTALDSGFENTKAFEWLKDNSYKYGFILRYGKTQTQITKYEYEPWHYRYVGKFHATKITDSKLTLEEYLETIKNKISKLKEEI